MALWTRADLRRRARERADMVNSQFVPDVTWNDWLQESTSALNDLLVFENEDYFTIPVAQTVPAGSNTLVIADLYKLCGVEWSPSGSATNGDWTTVRRFQFSERNRLSNRPNGRQCAVQYHLIGKNITFLPAQFAPGVYQVWYVPLQASMSADTDTVDGVNGWDQFIVLDTAIKAMSKEESDVSALLRELNGDGGKDPGVRGRITRMALRDYSEPERILDVRNCDEDC